MSFSKWQNTKKNVSENTSDLFVSTVFLEEAPELPIVFKCKVPNLDLALWYSNNEKLIEEKLEKYGAVLFRGFGVHDQDDFNAIVNHAIKKTAEYVEGATPRTHLKNGVYTATEFPADQEIGPHNELSYVTQPPSRIIFCCLKADMKGGQTHIVDVSKVFKRISNDTISEFSQRGGWMLRRNYGNGFGPTLEKAFGMNDAQKIESYCKSVDVKFNRVSENNYFTEQVRKAVHLHPVTGEELWFNHVVFWHPSSLCPKVKAKMEEVYSLSEFPYSTYYGDGSQISDDVIDTIRKSYRDEEVKFDWREGDVLLLDNWKVAHGRKPFEGDRSVLVAMG